VQAVGMFKLSENDRNLPANLPKIALRDATPRQISTPKPPAKVGAGETAAGTNSPKTPPKKSAPAHLSAPDEQWEEF
jgi:hypothetical protein